MEHLRILIIAMITAIIALSVTGIAIAVKNPCAYNIGQTYVILCLSTFGLITAALSRKAIARYRDEMSRS